MAAKQDPATDEIGRSTRNRQAKLTPDASRGWDALCEAHNVTYTALQEVLGLISLTRTDWLDVVDPDALRRVKAIDRERRSR